LLQILGRNIIHDRLFDSTFLIEKDIIEAFIGKYETVTNILTTTDESKTYSLPILTVLEQKMNHSKTPLPPSPPHDETYMLIRGEGLPSGVSQSLKTSLSKILC